MDPVAPPSKSVLEQLRKLVYGGSAIVLDDSKNYLFYARLSPIVIDEGLPSFDALIGRMAVDRRLVQRVVEAMTTNETSFFRDFHPFEALRKVVFPEIANTRKAARTLNIWSAASSTGQELYSIAFLIREMASFSGWSVRLTGTDLSTDVLARAREGRYSQLEVSRGLPTQMLARYFDKIETEWQVKDEIRKLAEFRRLNLIEPWGSLPQFDVVFLRNVLIYFDEGTRRKILSRLCSHIRPGGYLFLGGVESGADLLGRMTPVQIDKTICYRANPQGDKHVSVTTS